jgi:predicted dithiol-disulfide oxidoreductase (DUF899 family)
MTDNAEHWPMPAVVDRSDFEAELASLRLREKAHTREGDAIAAARRRLPRVQVDATTDLVGPNGAITLLDAFGDRVFETYWTTRRGVEVMDYSRALMDLTVYGRQETWEDSPAGWPQRWEANGPDLRTDGRPTAQWSRLEAGRSDDLGTTKAAG